MAALDETYRQLKSDLRNFKRTARLAAALPGFFRARVTLQRAEERITWLVENRVERFLEVVRSQIYERPGNPYLTLLRHAGCEFSDLTTSAKTRGLEETLAKLAGEGVYFTSDEFKGKTEVVRGRTSFRVSPEDFTRRDSPAGFVIQSSGTRNPPIETFSPLESIAAQAMGEAVFYAAHDLYSGAHAVYEPVLAGRMHFVLVYGKLGIPVDRWFAFNVAVHGALEDRYHYLNARLVATMGRRFGGGIANPENLPVGDLRPILDWIALQQRAGMRCSIKTVVSNAARIAREALAARVSLEGTRFIVSGEPATAVKRDLIEKAGARMAPRYGPGSGNGACFGCGNPRFIDEMHVPQSIFTFVENRRALNGGDHAIRPLMLTTVHPSAPRLLVNVENGDYGHLLERDCGCALERVGFTQHLHTIRSFEKLTSEGMNYFMTDMFELLERSIPREFGGGPGDYQLVEEEDERGQTRLTLVVHPAVGPIDEANLLNRLHRGLAAGSRNHRFMSGIWQDAGCFRIRRAVPHASARGKILPLHIKIDDEALKQ